MTANYPTIVRKFQPHEDGTEYVLAGHMNAVQDEVMAVESTLGAQPATFKPVGGSPTVYSTVGARLDFMQGIDNTQQVQINSLLDASRNGWSLPIANILASGTNIPTTQATNHVAVSTDWHMVRWTSALVDSDNIFSSGYYIPVPKTGWWSVTANVVMAIPAQSVDITHNVWARLRVLGSGSPSPYEIGADFSSAPEKSTDWHRLNLTSGDALWQGDRMYLEVRHDYIATDPTTVNRQTLSASGRIQLTYQRALPAQTVGGNLGRISTYFLPDEIDPNN